MGKHRGQAFDLMMILVDVGMWEGHLVLRKPCCAGGARQGWSRVPEGASTRGGVCFYLSACPGHRGPPPQVWARMGPGDALGAPVSSRGGGGT